MKTFSQAGRRRCGGSVHDRNCTHGGAFMTRAHHSPRYRILDGHGGGSSWRQLWAKLAPISRSLEQWFREPYSLRHDYLFTSTGAPKMRSALCLLMLLWTFPAMADQFSIVCHRQGAFYYFTFDDETKRVVVVSTASYAWKGYITSAMQDEIQFDILGHSRQEPTAGLAWNRGDGNIIRRGAPNPYPFADHCTETELRPSLLDYDRIPPTE